MENTNKEAELDYLEANAAFINSILRKYMVPTIISILGTTVVSFANSLLTGHFLGKEALAVMNLVSPITFLYAMLGCLICIGGATCTSVAMGKGDADEVNGYVSLSLLLTLIISIIISVFGLVFFRDLMTLLGATDNLFLLGASYGRMLLVSGVFTALMYYHFNFIRTDGRGSVSMGVFVLMAVLDIVLVYVFLRLGFEINGVGVAVIISTVIADILGMIFLFYSRKNTLHLGKITDVLNKSKNIFKRGAAAGINNGCNLLRTTVINAMILRFLGVSSVSVFAVVCSVINFTSASVGGSGQTVSPIIGVFFGERDGFSIKMVMKGAVRNSIVVHVIILVVLILTAKPISIFFGLSEAELINQSIFAIIIVGISFVPAAVNNVYIYYHMAVGRTFISSILTIARAFVLVAVLFRYFFAIGMDDYIYLSFVLAELITLAACLLINRIMHDEISDSDNMESIAFSTDINEQAISNTTAKITDFLDGLEIINQKVSMVLPLAIEEILVLIHEHTDKESKSADIRINIDKDKALMRIRCGGTLFDPISYYHERQKTLSEEELFMDDSLGIKMISQMASQVDFQRTFGVNNLIVTMDNQ